MVYNNISIGDIHIYYIYTRETPPSAGFPSPSGGVTPLAPTLETDAEGGGKRQKYKKKLGRLQRPIVL